MVREEPRVYRDFDLRFDRDSFFREIRIDAYPELRDDVERYLAVALPIARPAALVRIAYLGDRDATHVEIGGSRFESETLARNLEGIERVFAYTATCGRELYSLDLSDFDPFASFWHDTLKMMVLDSAVDDLCGRVAREFAIEKLSSMNPGSGNVDVWPISQQAPLFEVLEVAGSIGVELTPSFLMVPDKTVSGIYFASDREFVNCQTCTREICPDRRAPYRP